MSWKVICGPWGDRGRTVLTGAVKGVSDRLLGAVGRQRKDSPDRSSKGCQGQSSVGRRQTEEGQS